MKKRLAAAISAALYADKMPEPRLEDILSIRTLPDGYTLISTLDMQTIIYVPGPVPVRTKEEWRRAGLQKKH
jgi:hypothetical protein